MRTDFPPVLALAAKANAFFRGATSRMELLAGHPTFARFHDIAFVRQTGLGGEVVAEACVPWFRRLRNEGVDRVRPILDGMKLDKTADGAWGLLTESDRGLELWTASIGRRFQGHDDLQPLRLTMTSARFDRWSLRPPVEVEQASENLQKALEAAKDYLDTTQQSIAAAAVGKYLSLHMSGCPDVNGALGSLGTDLVPCALPLYASAIRVLELIEATGWLAAHDEAARGLAEPLWQATRVALESAV